MARTKGSQRERLVDAAVVVAARFGYRGASVARIVAQAKVSRATFYEHFGDRDECILAAHRMLAAPVERRLASEPQELGSPGSLRELIAELLEAVERSPAAARFLLVESLAAGPAVRAEHEGLLDQAEAAIETRLDSVPSDAAQLQLPTRALLGGIAGVVAIRAFRGEAGRITELLDELVAWVDSCAIPPGAARLNRAGWAALGKGLVGGEADSLGDEVLERRLPRGRGALSTGAVATEQRERIVAAVARLSREEGYAAMTVADVVATAKVTREAFYEHFRGKEDAFLATQAFGLEQSIAVTAGRYFGEEQWRDRVWNGVEATLSYVAGQTDLVFIDLVESYAAGPAAIRRSFENRMAYTIFLEDGYRERPEAMHLPRICSEAIGGAIYELMRRQVSDGQTARMLELLPQAAYVTLAPFLGPGEALRLVEAKLPRGGD